MQNMADFGSYDFVAVQELHVDAQHATCLEAKLRRLGACQGGACHGCEGHLRWH